MRKYEPKKLRFAADVIIVLLTIAVGVLVWQVVDIRPADRRRQSYAPDARRREAVNTLARPTRPSSASMDRPKLGVEDVARGINAKPPRLLLVDVSDREEFAAGHIPSAKNIPLDELEVRGPNELPTTERIVVYCNCLEDTKSIAALDILSAKGFQQSLILNGGLRAWKEGGYSLTRE